MNKFFLITLLNFFILQSYADNLSEAQIVDQQSAQQLCVQQKLSQCISRLCTGPADDHCTQTCLETIQNECRYAGE